uniref:CHRD domain-containing protein n=1 Tax=Ningiella ruwaisensis TaxID=2364274 RepID=UPI00109F960C|nr:CHRD domain-containing protein [Ningiella ruwaisensis]
MYKSLNKALLAGFLVSFSLLTQAAIIKATAMLDYGQEVAPSNPTPSDASGMATLMFNTDTSTVDIMAEITGISLADVTFPDGGLAFGNAGPFHIHNGFAGENGPIVVPFSLASYFSETATGISVMATGISFDSALITNLYAGGLYLNLHTLDYGSGEIRGQLAAVNAPAIAGFIFFVALILILRRN